MVPVSGGMTERQVQLIRDFEPRVIMVTPSYFLSILDEMERQGLDPKASSLRIGIFGAEPWTESMRREVEERTAMDAVDIYGLSEVIGPGVAQEAVETKDGLHIWEDHFYPEIVDPITGEVLPEGERGELVFTSLTKQAMPVLRYRTRDLTRLLPGSAYPAFRRMEKITGRSDDMMIVRGVNVFPTQVEELVLAEAALAPYFQCVLTRPGRLDELTVLVESHEVLADSEKVGRRRPAGLADQGPDRHDGARRGARPGRDRALGRQGPARRGQATSRLIGSSVAPDGRTTSGVFARSPRRSSGRASPAGWKDCPQGSTPGWGQAVAGCPAGRGRASRSRGPCCPAGRSCSSTSRSPTSTTRPPKRCWPTCSRARRTGRWSSSVTRR